MKTIITKAIAVIMCVLFLIPESSTISVAISSLESSPSITNEEIAMALQNAAFVDSDGDSAFSLHDTEEDIDSDFEFAPNYEDPDYEMPDELYAERQVALRSTTEIPGDPMVYYTQLWLNQTYGHIAEFDAVPENGKTGWPTIYGLIEALQYEMGITSLAKNFGATTSAVYQNNILSRHDGETDNKYAILQGALWCKGYNPGYNYHYDSSTNTVTINAVFDKDVEDAVIALKTDAGLVNPDGVVTLNVMKALMSMDAFKLLYSYGGDSTVRSMQQKLNRKYEDYIGLMPCDGVYGRNTNKALIYALQAEEGMPVSVANGNFGNTTKLCCPLIPYVKSELAARRYPGDEDSAFYTDAQIASLTELLQFALYVNGYTSGYIDGVYGRTTQQNLINFQKDYVLPQTGKANLSTWLSLFISCGDKNRSALACDCATILTAEKAQTLYNGGYRYVGRYLTGTYNGGISKAITSEEAQIIFNAGLRFFPIYQTSARQESYFTEAQGVTDANAAIKAASILGVPRGTVIYFAVDFDAMDYQITNSILPYFLKVNEIMSDSIYNTGVYGTRNVCSRVSAMGYARNSFVGDMSTGFSGNLGFSMPANWAFDQFATVTVGSGSGQIEIDKDGFSGKDMGVGYLDRNIAATYTVDSFNAGTAENETLIGPTVNIMRNEVPLFTLDLNFTFPSGFLVESEYDDQHEELNVIIGVDLYQYSEDTTGVREKPEGEKYKQAFREVTQMVSAIGKNDSVFKKKYQDFKGSLYDRGLNIGFQTTASFVGYMTISFKTGEPVLKNGEIGMIGRVLASYEYPIIPTVNVKFAIEGSLELGLKLVKRSVSTIDLAGHLALRLTPSISVGVNAYIASAYIGAKGELECTLQFPFENFLDSFTAELNAKVFFEYDVLKYGGQAEWPFYHLQIYPPNTNNTRQTNNTPSFNKNDLSLLSPSDHSVGRTINPSNTIESQVQLYAKPQLISLGGQRMFMVYIGDDSTRSNENSAILLYRVFDGTSWSEAYPVLDDNTNDFEPIICSDGVGGVHILWQNATTTFNANVTVEDMSAAIDLYYTHWNGSSFEGTQRITSNNQTPEMNYKIACSNQSISVVWMENSNDDIFGLSGSNSIYQKNYVSGSWGTATLISSNLSLVNSIDVAYLNSVPTVIYTAKSGSNSTSIEDFEVFRYSSGQTQRLTNDTSADLYAIICGSTAYWNSAGYIKSLDLLDSSADAVVLSQDNIGLGKIEVFEDNNNSVLVVWSISDQNDSTFYKASIDLTSPTLELDNPSIIEKDAGVVRGWDVCVQSSGDVQLAYCYADYIGSDDLTYGDLRLIQTAETTVCDLAVDPVAYYVDSENGTNEITVHTDLYNVGSTTVNQVLVTVENSNGQTVASANVSVALDPGEQTELSTALTFTDNLLSSEYTVLIQPVGNTDYNSSDNTAHFSTDNCDLYFDELEEVRNDSIRQIKAVVANYGIDAAQDVVVNCYKESVNGELVSTRTIALINGQDSTELFFALNTDDLNSNDSESARTYCFTIQSDQAESDYENNFQSISVYPDYYVTLSSVSGGTVSGGGLFAANTVAELQATPSPGYMFDGWYENGQRLIGVPETYYLIVNQNRSFEARFIQSDFSITNVSVTGKMLTGQSISIFADATGGTFPYQWSFAILINDKLVKSAKSQDNSVCSFTPKEDGYYHVIISATDSTGTTISNDCRFYVQKVYQLTIGKPVSFADKIPENAQVLYWISDNPKVATVSKDGIVSAKRIGSTTITAVTTKGSYTWHAEVKFAVWQIILIFLGVGALLLPFWVVIS